MERLYISNLKAVQLLTIHASVYQNESESKSYAVTWGIRTRFADGSSGFVNRPCYGYRQNDEGGLVPIPEEAEIVRYMFEWRQQGFSLRRIVVALSGKGIKSPRGHNDWSVETIRKILKNEKYHGDVILQKTFVSDYFAGMQSENRDRLNKYLIENSHKAIV